MRLHSDRGLNNRKSTNRRPLSSGMVCSMGFWEGPYLEGESIHLLDKALPKIPSNRPYRLKEAFYSLIYDYSNLYRYADAFRIYGDLVKNFPCREKDDDYN